MILPVMVQVILTAASIAYQYVTQRNAQRKADKARDEAIGIDVVVDGRPVPLPIIYGPAKISGVRTDARVMSNITVKEPHSGVTAFVHPNTKSGSASDFTGSVNKVNPFNASSYPTRYSRTSGSANRQFLITQQALAVDSITEFVDVEIDGESWDSDNFEFGQWIFAYKEGGDPDPTAVFNGFPNTNRFTNTVNATCVFRLDRDNYNYSGPPNVSFYVKGKAIHGINSNGTLTANKRYSTNPAEILLDYLISDYGKKLSLAEIDTKSFYDAAQICNTIVENPGKVGGRINGVRPNEDGSEPSPVNKQIKLYEAGLVIDTSKPFRENVVTILSTMGEADLIWSEGQYKLLLTYPTTNAQQNALITATYNESNAIREPQQISWTNTEERLNQVTINFSNEYQDFVSDSVTWPDSLSAQHLTYLDEDNGVQLTATINLDGTTTTYHAKARAEQIVRDSRYAKIFDFTIGPEGLIHEPGDLVRLNFPSSGIDNEVYKILEVKVLENLNVELRARRYSWQNLTWVAKSPIIYVPRRQVSKLVPNPVSLAYNSGPRLPNLRTSGHLTWTAPNTTVVKNYIVNYKLSSSNTWERLGVSEHTFYDIFTPLPAGTYDFRVRTQNMNGSLSAGAVVTGIVISTLPTPSNLTFVARYNNVLVDWDQAQENRVAHWNILMGDTSNLSSVFFTKKAFETKTTIAVDKFREDRFVWVQAENRAGVVSSHGGPILVRAQDIPFNEVDVLAEEIKQLLNDAGMSPVEIFDTLPVTDNFEGRTVYLTTDQKLYRYDGANWISAVPAVDITGQLSSSQIADGAINKAKIATGLSTIEILGTLPATGNFAGRTVFLTSDSKLYRHTGSPSDASGFTAVVPAADITGTLTNSQIADLAASKLTGQITAPQIADGAVTDAKIAGIAAAKITGQLTNAQIAALEAAKLTGQITGTQITDGAISTAKLSAGSVTTAKLAAGAVTADTIAANAVTSVKIAAGSIEASKIAAGAVQAGSIAAGAVTADKIAANAIDATKIAAGTITAAELAAGSVTTAKLAAGAVTADTIAANAVTSVKIAANAVTANEIAAGAVTADKVATNAIVAGKIAAGAVTSNEIAANSIFASRLILSDITNLVRNHTLENGDGWLLGATDGIIDVPSDANMANSRAIQIPDTISANTFAIYPGIVEGGQSYYISCEARCYGLVPRQFSLRLAIQWYDSADNLISTSAFTPATITTNVPAVYGVAFTAPSNAVSARFLFGRAFVAGEAKLAFIANPSVRLRAGGELIVDGAITADKVAANAITAGKVAANAITSDKIAANSVTTSELASNAVTAGIIAAGAVTTAKLAASAVTADKIAANSITASELAANSINSVHINAGAIVAGKMAANSITAANAAIANAAVDTLQINGEAVITPIRAINLNDITITAAGRPWENVLSVTFTKEPYWLEIFFSAEVRVQGVSFRLSWGGGVIRTFPSASGLIAGIGVHQNTGGPASHTYVLQARADNGGGSNPIISQRSMTLAHFKR